MSRFTLTGLLTFCALLTMASCAITGSPTGHQGGRASSLSIPAEIKGSIGPEAPINKESGDRYRTHSFRATSGDIIYFAAYSEDFSPRISVVDSAGLLLDSDELMSDLHEVNTVSYGRAVHAYSAYSDSFKPFAEMFFWSQKSGTYYLVVSAPEGSSLENYTIHTNIVDDDNEVELPGMIGACLLESPRMKAPERRFYQTYDVRVDEESLLDIAMTGLFSTKLYLYSTKDGSRIAQSPTSNADRYWATRIVEHVEPGDYQIQSSSNETTGYLYSLNVRTHPISSFSDSFSSGTPYEGFLGKNRHSPPYSDLLGLPLEFEVKEPFPFHISMRSTQIYPILILADSKGRFLEEVTPSGRNNFKVEILRSLEPGKYTIWASSRNNMDGAFSLHARPFQGFEPEGRVRLGDRLRGTLRSSTTNRCPIRQTLIMVYELKIEKPKHVLLDLESRVFDTYLILEDEDGNTIAENDDARPNTTNSRILRQMLPAGTYRVGVTTATPQDEGAFMLRVNEAH